MAEKQNPTKGDLVYITDDNSPPLSWPLGFVHETYTGNDNLVRVVKIKTGNGIFSNRPIVKLRKIPINSSLPQSGSSGKLSCRKKPTRSRLPSFPRAHFRYLCTRTREILTTDSWTLTSRTNQAAVILNFLMPYVNGGGTL